MMDDYFDVLNSLEGKQEIESFERFASIAFDLEKQLDSVIKENQELKSKYKSQWLCRMYKRG